MANKGVPAQHGAHRAGMPGENCPTHANNGLEWATRPYLEVAHIAKPKAELMWGRHSARGNKN